MMKNRDYSKEKEELQKMRKLLANIRVLMMATNLEKIPFSVCPMTLQDIDEQGDLWFFTPRDSDHFRDIEKDNRVQLLASNEKEKTYLSIYGNAVHIVDEQKLDALWNPMLKAWFKGKDDPNLALLNINIESVYYWDNGDNKFNSLYQLTGNNAMKDQVELGEKGHVNLQNH